MMNPIIQLILAQRDLFQERVTARILKNIPRYSLTGGKDIRGHVDQLIDDLVHFMQTGEEQPVLDRTHAISSRRIAQGFTLAEFLQALLTSIPSIRELARESGVDTDPQLVRGLDHFESAIYKLAAAAADEFVDDFAHQLQSKNLALNRLNQTLRAQERAVSMSAEQARKELETANEFNRRVLESLTDGLMVVDSQQKRVSLYTSRMEEIVGLPAEQVLGRPVDDVFEVFEGLPARKLVEVVKARGKLPLSKFHLTRLDGSGFSVLVRAQRMYSPAGEPEGTVVVVDDVSERELLLDSFSRYVSRDLVLRVLARAEPLKLGAERRTCTVMFTDIRGFTGLAERLQPEQLHELINAYFRVVIDNITTRGGFIDKFVGDNVMALFDGRKQAAEGAMAALAAAEDIIRDIQALNKARCARSLPSIDVGVGVNTGEVLLGNIGSDERMDFTAIGDPVNIADRLQNLADTGQVLLGAETARLVGDRFQLVDRGDQSVRGRKQTVQVFELVLTPDAP